MKRLIGALTMAAIVAGHSTPAFCAKAALPPLLKEIETKYAQAKTITANFTQVNLMAAMEQKKTSTGTLMFKLPGKVRWETTKPDPNLLISDGKTYWYYTPPFDADEHGQLVVKKSSEVQAKLANTLLAGSFSQARDMSIKEEAPTKYLLTPRRGARGTVSKAALEINPTTKLIEKVTLWHKGGNETEISLTQIELGKEIPDTTFKFTAPPNTDRVTGKE